MTLIAPDRGELWWETALLHSRLGNMRTAIATLETYLAGNDQRWRFERKSRICSGVCEVR